MLTVEHYGRIRAAHRDGMSIRSFAWPLNQAVHKVSVAELAVAGSVNGTDDPAAFFRYHAPGPMMRASPGWMNTGIFVAASSDPQMCPPQLGKRRLSRAANEPGPAAYVSKLFHPGETSTAFCPLGSRQGTACGMRNRLLRTLTAVRRAAENGCTCANLASAKLTNSHKFSAPVDR